MAHGMELSMIVVSTRHFLSFVKNISMPFFLGSLTRASHNTTTCTSYDITIHIFIKIIIKIFFQVKVSLKNAIVMRLNVLLKF